MGQKTQVWSVLALPVSVWQIGHAHHSQERHLCLDEEAFNGKTDGVSDRGELESAAEATAAVTRDV